MDLSPNAKAGIASFLVFIALSKVFLPDAIASRMDVTFFSILVFAFIVVVLPWKDLESFKAAGIEITVGRLAVQAAISGLGLERVDDEKLRQQLTSLEDELKIARGSRVIWIDDKPHQVLGARRMLRALDIDVTTAVSSEDAEKLLQGDNDFDLIITDVQRRGTHYKEVEGGIEIHEGVNFIVALRKNDDPNIRVMPVIFYAAYDWERLVKFTRPARETLPEPQISNAMEDFLPKVIKTLAEERSKPIAFRHTKKPTPVD